jgi:hypothetical protein
MPVDTQTALKMHITFDIGRKTNKTVDRALAFAA